MLRPTFQLAEEVRGHIQEVKASTAKQLSTREAQRTADKRRKDEQQSQKKRKADMTNAEKESL